MRKVSALFPAKFRPLAMALLLSSLLSVVLFAIRVVGSEDMRYYFMLWNLFLAWLPLVFAVILYQRLQRQRWLTWQNIALTVLWLGFLPNSFYMLTDLIHLQSTGDINILFDAVMFSSFIYNGFVLGFLSVYLVHAQLLRRRADIDSHLLIGAVFLLCGFAIYLGRSMRWNTWDIVANPAGLLFDVSEGIVDPLGHPQIFVTTVTFFLLLSAVYAVIYQAVRAIRAPQHR